MNSSKKASGIGDLIVIFLILFITALVVLIAQPIRQGIEDEMVADPDINESVKTYLQENNTMQEEFWDSAMIVILVFLTIVVMISSYFVDSHPVFFFVFVIFLIIVMIAAAGLSNAYIELSTDAGLEASVAVYPKINWLMTKWPFVLLVQAFLVGAVLYAKFRLFE